MHTFDSASLEVQYLKSQDGRLGELLERLGKVTLVPQSDFYSFLVHTIIGQQLSATVASVLSARVTNICGQITPDSVAGVTDESLRSCGISKMKIAFLRDLTARALAERTLFERLQNKTNDEILAELTKIKGIGPWTAEMFLIFALERRDVFSDRDAGLQRAMRWLYNVPHLTDKQFFLRQSEAWMPYRSVASLFLWEAVNRGYVDQYPTLEKVL